MLSTINITAFTNQINMLGTINIPEFTNHINMLGEINIPASNFDGQQESIRQVSIYIT